MFVRNGKNVQGNCRENRKVYIAEENMMIVSKMPQRNQLTDVFLSRFYIDKLDVYDVCKRFAEYWLDIKLQNIKLKTIDYPMKMDY